MDFEKAKNIELIIFDVDGVFTDGKINCTPNVSYLNLLMSKMAQELQYGTEF